MADETKRVEVICGPYRGNHLTMTTADADAAIGAHWARNPNEPYGDHDPLSEAERQEALDASHAWAKVQWDAAQGIAPPDPPETIMSGETERRSMLADRPASYQTREAPKSSRR